MREKIPDWERWFIQASDELEDARYNLEGGRYHLVCFLAQQAAEKALKAFLYFNGAEEVWGHSLYALLEDAAAFDREFDPEEGRFRELPVLDKYYLSTRYPDVLAGGIPSRSFARWEAEKALELAGELIDYLSKKLRREGDG